MHFLPKYARETNPTQRVWWHLHETITRHQCCSTIDELLDEIVDSLDANYSDHFEMRSTFAAAA